LLKHPKPLTALLFIWLDAQFQYLKLFVKVEAYIEQTIQASDQLMNQQKQIQELQQNISRLEATFDDEHRWALLGEEDLFEILESEMRLLMKPFNCVTRFMMNGEGSDIIAFDELEVETKYKLAISFNCCQSTTVFLGVGS
jgi:hypothetical protein